MIETGIIFFLGVLTTALVALLVGPVLWRRAARLATERVLATTPLRLSELAAQKDLVRAEHAVARRRVEVRLEHARALTAKQQIELGRRDERLHELTVEAAGLNTARAELAARVEDLKATIRGLEKQVTEQGAALKEKQHAISTAHDALRARTTELAELHAQFEPMKIELAALRAQRDAADFGEETRPAAAAGTARPDDLTAKIHELRTELSARELRIARYEAEERAAKRHAERRRRIAATRRARTVEMRRELENARGKIAEQRIELSSAAVRSASGEARRQDEIEEAGKLKARIARLETELADRDQALEQAKTEITAAQAAEPERDVEADEALRESMRELAARITRTAAESGGDDLRQLIESSGKPQPRRPARRQNGKSGGGGKANGTAVNGKNVNGKTVNGKTVNGSNGHGAGNGIPLADRIRQVDLTPGE